MPIKSNFIGRYIRGNARIGGWQSRDNNRLPKDFCKLFDATSTDGQVKKIDIELQKKLLEILENLSKWLNK